MRQQLEVLWQAARIIASLAHSIWSGIATCRLDAIVFFSAVAQARLCHLTHALAYGLSTMVNGSLVPVVIHNSDSKSDNSDDRVSGV